LLVLYLELKEEVSKPTVGNSLSRVLLEEEYNLLGYGVIKLNKKDGRIDFGEYKLELHEGDVFIEEIENYPKNGGVIELSL
jgi:hypothetical protein